MLLFWQCILYHVILNHTSQLLATLKKKPFENIEGKGENAGYQQITLFSHNVVYPSQIIFQSLIHIYFVICKCFQFWPVFNS